MPSAQGDKPVGARNGHRGPTHQTIAARACSGRKDMSNSPSPHPISKAIPGCQIRALSGTGSCGKPRGLTRCHGCPSQSPMILAIRHRRGLDARAIYSSHDKTRKNENERQVRMAMILGVKKERMRTRGGAGNPVLDGVCLSILPRVVVCCLHSMNWTAVCAERQQPKRKKNNNTLPGMKCRGERACHVGIRLQERVRGLLQGWQEPARTGAASCRLPCG